MKKIIGISSVFIGLVIGAGFASGREIFEYFCLPSQVDFTGIILASFAFSAVCYIIMHLAKKINTPDFSSFISKIAGKFRIPVKLFMLSFMFCGFFIMMSACGVLAKETLGLPPICGIIFLGLVCFFVFIFDAKGLVAFNTILVPLMIAGMVFLCLSSLLAAAPVFSFPDITRRNPLLSALCYVSYNTVTAGAVLVPLSASASKKQIASASAFSGFVLGLLIYIGWLSMNRFFDTLITTEMPLLALAADKGAFSKGVYTFVLFSALCTTAVSHGFGILGELSCSPKANRTAAAAVLCLFAMPFAGFGFSNLISNIYSAFGYVGIFWTGLIIFRYIRA